MRVTARVLEALHSVGLTGASLTVGQYSGVVAFQDGANCMLSRAIVNMLLRRVHIVDLVEAIRVPDGQVRIHLDVPRALPVLHLAPKILHHRNVSILSADLHDRQEVVALLLSLEGRAQADHYFEVLLR